MDRLEEHCRCAKFLEGLGNVEGWKKGLIENEAFPVLSVAEME